MQIQGKMTFPPGFGVRSIQLLVKISNTADLTYQKGPQAKNMWYFKQRLENIFVILFSDVWHGQIYIQTSK